jgi:hypothetical protein
MLSCMNNILEKELEKIPKKTPTMEWMKEKSSKDYPKKKVFTRKLLLGEIKSTKNNSFC